MEKTVRPVKARPNDKCWMTQHAGCMLDVSTCWKLRGYKRYQTFIQHVRIFSIWRLGNMVAGSVVWQCFYAWRAWLKKLRMEGGNEAKLEAGFEGDKRAVISTILYWENWPSKTRQLIAVILREIEKDIPPHQFFTLLPSLVAIFEQTNKHGGYGNDSMRMRAWNMLI